MYREILLENLGNKQYFITEILLLGNKRLLVITNDYYKLKSITNLLLSYIKNNKHNFYVIACLTNNLNKENYKFYILNICNTKYDMTDQRILRKYIYAYKTVCIEEPLVSAILSKDTTIIQELTDTVNDLILKGYQPLITENFRN